MRFFAQVAADKGILQPAGEWAGAVKRQRHHDVIHRLGVDLPQRGAHARAFDLEAANGAPVADDLRDQRVVFGDGFQHRQARR